MEPQTKRTITATLLCMIAFVVWMRVQSALQPDQPPAPTTQDFVEAETGTESASELEPEGRKASPAPDDSSGTTDAVVASTVPGSNADGQLVAPLYRVVGGDDARTVTLGDDRQDRKGKSQNPFEFAAVISSQGAGVDSVRLSGQRNKVAKNRKAPDHDPYDLLKTVEDSADGTFYRSFVTERIQFRTDKKKEVSDGRTCEPRLGPGEKGGSSEGSSRDRTTDDLIQCFPPSS